MSPAAALRISLVQTALEWQNAAANRAHFSELLAPLAGETDIVVLPEMFTTGFSMAAHDLAEPPQGPSVAWMQAQARQLDAVLLGSLIVEVDGRCFNRLHWVTPEGGVSHYDKRHLFRMGDEHRVFCAGDKTLLCHWRGARIAPLICYDLRFPVWSRRRPDYDYDVLIYVANWPNKRAYAWTQLLKARAIENQAVTIGVNRVGRDGIGVPHQGDSAAFDALGHSLLELGAAATVATVKLDLASQVQFREKFPAQLDADRFQLLP
jgi:predicted amidohydrolase